MAGSELETELKIAVAAQDSDLVAYYEMRMKGDTDKVDDDRAARLEAYTAEQMEHETRYLYGLSEGEYRVALGRCVAVIAEIQIGSGHFSG